MIDDQIAQQHVEIDDTPEWKRDFTERELRLIDNCQMYANNSPAGLPGHNLMIIIDKLCKALAAQ